MTPELRLLKKMAVVAGIGIPAASVVAAGLAGARIGISVATGAMIALAALGLSAGGAALFGRAGNQMVAASYAVGFFVKLGLVTAFLFAIRKVETISMTALAVSLACSYLSLLVVAVANAGTLTLLPTESAGESVRARDSQ